MALYPIQVTYTPQTVGDHIICYQQINPVNDGVAYCCMRDTTASVVGVPKMFEIPNVAIPSCDESGSCTAYTALIETTFNGFVYPACDASVNHDLQTAWAVPVTFTPIL